MYVSILSAVPRCDTLILTSSIQPSEAQHLLNEPYPPNHYGTTGPDNRNSPQVDPEEIRKQRDALERLCAATSEYAVSLPLNCEQTKALRLTIPCFLAN